MNRRQAMKVLGQAGMAVPFSSVNSWAKPPGCFSSTVSQGPAVELLDKAIPWNLLPGLFGVDLNDVYRVADGRPGVLIELPVRTNQARKGLQDLLVKNKTTISRAEVLLAQAFVDFRILSHKDFMGLYRELWTKAPEVDSVLAPWEIENDDTEGRISLMVIFKR